MGLSCTHIKPPLQRDPGESHEQPHRHSQGPAVPPHRCRGPTCTRRMASPPPTRALSRYAIQPPPAGVPVALAVPRALPRRQRAGTGQQRLRPQPPRSRRAPLGYCDEHPQSTKGGYSSDRHSHACLQSAGLAQHATSRQLCGDQACLGFGLSGLQRLGLVVDNADTPAATALKAWAAPVACAFG